MLCLLALSDEGAPVHDHRAAADLAALGATVMACTPDEFPDVLAAALERADRPPTRSAVGVGETFDVGAVAGDHDQVALGEHGLAVGVRELTDRPASRRPP